MSVQPVRRAASGIAHALKGSEPGTPVRSEAQRPTPGGPARLDLDERREQEAPLDIQSTSRRDEDEETKKNTV